MGYDFSGYATRNDLTCGDGLVIRKNAFKDDDGKTVPLVWHHIHNDPMNVLGHAALENREDGVYAYCYLNDTPQGQNAKAIVKHGDITSMSIYANKLQKRGKDIMHGVIREVSLVLAGANPGATIDPLSVRHSDELGEYIEELDDEVIIHTGLNFVLADDDNKPELDDISHADDEEDDMANEKDDETIQDVIDSMSEKQKNVMYYVVGQALKGKSGDDTAEHDDMEDDMAHHNIFDQTDAANDEELLHSEIAAAFADGPRIGNLKDAFIAHGIENLEVLLPDYKNLDNTPTFIRREVAWVSALWGALKKMPFARIRSRYANITEYEARARGYIKGNQKIEEYFKIASRVTTPTTVYKLQKLDRDDIIDITDMDVVAWMKQEMRGMLNEELATAVLIGDGRPANDVSKINEQNIRPIYHDDDLFCMHKKVTIPQNATDVQIAKAIIRMTLLSRKDYKGSGAPWFITTNDIVTRMMLAEDQIGHPLYKTEAELCAALRVSKILEVPVLEGATRQAAVQTEQGATVFETRTLLGIIVDPIDYVIGADKGGAVTMFDDFNLDYNKYEYLIETRCSGALKDPYTAIALETTDTLPFDFGPRSGDYSTATKTKDANGWPEGYDKYTPAVVDDGE